MGGENGLWGMGDHTRPVWRLRPDDAHPADLPPAGPHPRGPDQRHHGEQLRLPADGARPISASATRLRTASPGRDFSPVLAGRGDRLGRTSIFYEMGTRPRHPDRRLEIRPSAPRRALRAVRHGRRPQRASSTSTASPGTRTASSCSRSGSTPSSTNMPTPSTTSGTGAARRRGGSTRTPGPLRPGPERMP